MRGLVEHHAGGTSIGSHTRTPGHQPILWERDINHKVAYQQRLQAQLKKWEAGINSLQAEAGRGQSGDQPEIRKALFHPDRIADLRDRLAVARAKLTELEHADQDAWGALQEDTERVWDEIGDAMNSGNQRFE